jgi:membrane-associated phospholipid phosphatase
LSRIHHGPADRDARLRTPRTLRDLFFTFLIAALATTRVRAAAALEPLECAAQDEADPDDGSSRLEPPPANDETTLLDDISREQEQEETGLGDATTDKPYWRTNFFRRFFSDQKYLFTDWLPSEVHRPSFTIPLLVGTGVAFAASRDQDASQPDLSFERDFSSDTTGSTAGVARTFTNLGDGPAGLLLIGTAYLAGRWSGHDRFAESASLSAEAVLDTGLWVSVLKGLSARTRPSAGGTGQFFQYHPAGGQQNGSFPSGHASGAFAAATVFAGMYREDHRWVPWVAYGTATLVSASRVALGRHFPTDVFVGALIGNSFGRMVLSRDQPASRAAKSGITPFYDPASGAEGVVWHREW